MGLDFRNGSYTRFVRCGKRTIKAGEAAAIWNVNGVHREIVGPKLEYLWYSQIRFLDYFAASKDEYLHVTLLDGREEHIPGPFGLYKNPVFHKSIAVKTGFKLMSKNESLVVYSSVPSFANTEDEIATNGLSLTSKPKDKKSGTYSSTPSNLVMRVINGPATFFPTPEDKIHNFNLGDRELNILNIVQDFYCLPFNINTKDDEKSEVSFDVKVAIKDIKVFTDANVIETLKRRIAMALSNDVISYTANLTWREVNSSLRSIVSDSSSSWVGLKSALRDCGCELMNCTYLNVKQSAELIKSQSDKIQKLATLEHNAAADAKKIECEKQEMALAAAREEADLLYTMKQHQQELEKEEAILKHNINKIEAEQELKTKQAAFESKLIREKEALKSELNERKNGEVISFLKEIKGLDVDITKLLVGAGSDHAKGNDSANKNQGYSLVCKMVEEAPAFQAVWKKEDATEDLGFEVVKKQRGV